MVKCGFRRHIASFSQQRHRYKLRLVVYCSIRSWDDYDSLLRTAVCLIVMEIKSRLLLKVLLCRSFTRDVLLFKVTENSGDWTLFKYGFDRGYTTFSQKNGWTGTCFFVLYRSENAMVYVERRNYCFSYVQWWWEIVGTGGRGKGSAVEVCMWMEA